MTPPLFHADSGGDSTYNRRHQVILTFLLAHGLSVYPIRMWGTKGKVDGVVRRTLVDNNTHLRYRCRDLLIARQRRHQTFPVQVNLPSLPSSLGWLRITVSVETVRPVVLVEHDESAMWTI